MFLIQLSSKLQQTLSNCLVHAIDIWVTTVYLHLEILICVFIYLQNIFN